MEAANAIETTELPLEVEHDERDDLDETAVEILQAAYVAMEMLEELKAAIDAGAIDPDDPPAPITQEYIDALEDAYHCFTELTERDDYEEFLRDVSVLDREMLAEVRGSIVYVASHFGIEIELPAPGDAAGEGGA